MNLAIITLDSLRYDVAREADTPYLDSILSDWVKVYAHGTYTLPSHMALFHNGYLPNNNQPEIPGPYNADKERLFRVEFNHPGTNTPVLYPTHPQYSNIVKGLSAEGYRTVGVGGVGWFRVDMDTSCIWKSYYFDEFYHQGSFLPHHPNSFEDQIELCSTLELKSRQPLFFFLNVASTHSPYRNRDVHDIHSQYRALEYVDSHFMKLIDLLPRPLHLIIMADHGECFGEGGRWGHGFYHPKVMEVPMSVTKLD